MALSWDQLISLAGAGFVLGAYALQNFGPANRLQSLYLWLNVIGAVGLLIPAWLHRQYGFIVVQGFWILISLISWLRLVLKKEH